MLQHKIKRVFRRVALLLLLCGLFGLWLIVDTQGETRSARGDRVIVKDGDTISIAGLDHRLHGIDAPEYRQICKNGAAQDWQCGVAARTALVALVSGKVLTCEERARDKYQRVVATCVDDKGRDIARALAEQGMAVSMDGWSEGPYAGEVEIARAKMIGIWQGRFDPPATWRTEHGSRP